MRHLKKEDIICFTAYELKELHRNDGKEKLRKILEEKNYSWEELNKDYSKKKEIADIAAKNNLKCKEQIEILSALNTCVVFFGEDCEIGFPLKNSYSIERNPIQSLEYLKNATEEGSLVDFSIIRDKSIWYFQLKQYRGVLGTVEFLEFIENKLKKYGDKIRNVNLLILIQGSESIGIQKLNINFEKITEQLNSRNRKYGGFILARFNEGNKFDHLFEIYPNNYEIKHPIDRDYLAGKLLYS